MREKESTAIFPPQSPASISMDNPCDDASRLVGARLPGSMFRHIGGAADPHSLCPSRIGGEHRYRSSERPRVRHWNDEPGPFSPHKFGLKRQVRDDHRRTACHCLEELQRRYACTEMALRVLCDRESG